MTYKEYIKFYNLEKTNDTYLDWLCNEWHHGRVYQFEGEFYSVLTGEKVCPVYDRLLKENKSMVSCQINRKKLKDYLENDMIMEFSSADECLDYFNTYDFKNFNSVNEMKAYQGEYGFGLDGKWYHISFDEALDVWEALSLSAQIQYASYRVAETPSSLNRKSLNRNSFM